jgi:O-antigen ligase
LAFAAGSVVMGVAWDRRVLVGLAVIAVLFALFAPSDFRSRALSVFELQHAGPVAPDSVTTAAESNSSRIQMVKTGWKMFLDRPVFGWGDIGLRPYYVTYVTPLTSGEGGHLHNNFMEALVTLGVPGFCAVLWLFYRMFAVIRRSGRGAPKDSFRGALAAGLLAAYAGFHVLGLFEYNFGDHEVMVLVWFLTGLAVAVPATAPDITPGPA